MEFFKSAIDTLELIVCMLGAGTGVLGIITFLQGQGASNGAQKLEGISLFMAGAAIVVVGITLIPELKSFLPAS